MNEIRLNGSKAFINPILQKTSQEAAKITNLVLPKILARKEIRVTQAGFTDAFTQVASQTNDKVQRIVMAYSKHVFLSKGLNLLQRIFGRIFNTKAYREYAAENKSTVAAFRNFLVEEYGKKKVDQVAYQFRSKKIDIDHLIKENLPLTQEIVYLYNIGVNNIEQQDVDSLSTKLSDFNSDDKKDENESLKDALLDDKYFTARETRGILRKMQQVCEGREPTVKDFRNHFFPQVDPELKTVRVFNELVDILMPQGEEFYTGRKINEPIDGGNHNSGLFASFKPWLDQQELLEVFQDLKDAKNWKSYHENLAKIVVKKHLIREDEHDIVRVGALIPAPTDRFGNPRWYRVEEALISGRGKMAYTLVPAHPDYSLDMPIIRLYRNTTLSTYALDAGPTITRDLYPNAPPGYLFSDVTRKQDQEFFNQFIAQDFQTLQNAKNNRPLALVGDSLGGSDAQIDLCKFFSNAKALPNTNIELYAFSSPAIKRKDNRVFLQYVLENQEILQMHGIEFKIYHRVDSEDVIPGRISYKKGKMAKHLGYGMVLRDLPLKVSMVVCKVNPETKHAPLQRVSHFRSYAKATKDVDYFKDKVAVHEFDDSPRKEYSLLKFVRKQIFCTISETVWKISRFFFGRLMEKAADADGIIHAKFRQI